MHIPKNCHEVAGLLAPGAAAIGSPNQFIQQLSLFEQQNTFPVKRRIRSTETEVPFPLAPMIDLTFLLLIFFMVTSRISKEPQQEMIQLPIAQAGVLPPDASHRDIINIDKDGTFSIGKKNLDRLALEAHLRRRLQSDSKRKLYLRADAATPAKKIKDILRLATETGATQILMGVHPP
ncbi:MAG: hypothetical protein C5B47_01915 [Verrucomicrobia bacterium]|nr:MAG: hypothetical protein C5B47_01915 [Verrucomicrobiota bacterium]